MVKLLKVVVIGSNGLLGQTLVNKLVKNDDFEVFAMAHGANRNKGAIEFSYHEISIDDNSHIKILLKEIAPDYVINALAMTNVDACEVEQETCYDINVRFVEDLTKICKSINSFLIHISTDFIFDGEHGPYKETDRPNPLNYYGESKLLAEKVVQENLKSYAILRTILVYGKVDGMKRSNILLWLKGALAKGEKVTIVNDQFRMPTYVGSLADACILVMQKKAAGIYHISDDEFLSIYDMALQIADFYKFSKDLIHPISTSILNQKAKRPSKTGFDLSKAKIDLGFKPLTFKEALTRFENELT